MISPPFGFDPDPQEWLHYNSWVPAVALECYPLVMRALISECDLQHRDLIEAIPEADALDLLDLTVTSCPDHPNQREYFLAYETAEQLMRRIDEKFPTARTEWMLSAQLALRVLYNAIREAHIQRDEDEKDGQ